MTLEPRTPFNEQAALAELERLQQAILATRRKRQQALAEFQVFLDRCREPAVAPVAAEVSVAVPLAAPPAVAAAPIEAERVDLVAAGAPPRRRWPTLAAAIGGLVVAGLAGFMWWRTLQGSAPAEPRGVPSSQVERGARATLPDSGPVAPEPTPGPAPASAPTPSPVSAVPEAPLRITLATSRTVWMRVMVDGRRQLEREVPAGERLNFSAGRGVVVRAGDAGGVTLTVNGVDQGVLGRDYAIAMKTIDVP